MGKRKTEHFLGETGMEQTKYHAAQGNIML